MSAFCSVFRNACVILKIYHGGSIKNLMLIRKRRGKLNLEKCKKMINYQSHAAADLSMELEICNILKYFFLKSLLLFEYLHIFTIMIVNRLLQQPVLFDILVYHTFTRYFVSKFSIFELSLWQQTMQTRLFGIHVGNAHLFLLCEYILS